MSTVDQLVAYALVAAAVVIGGRFFVEFTNLNKRMGPPNWDFSKSFASTLTAFGAILGTILAATDVVPKNPQHLSKAAYAGLNVLFGVIALLAPVVYAAFQTVKRRHGKKGVQELQYEGFVWSFLLASAFTLWAVLGELATVALLIDDIQARGDFPTVSSGVLILVVVAGAALLVMYVWRATGWIIKYQLDLPAHKKRLIAEFESDGLSLELATGVAAPTTLQQKVELADPAPPAWSVL